MTLDEARNAVWAASQRDMDAARRVFADALDPVWADFAKAMVPVDRDYSLARQKAVNARDEEVEIVRERAGRVCNEAIDVARATLFSALVALDAQKDGRLKRWRRPLRWGRWPLRWRS